MTLHRSMPCRAMRVGLQESRVSTPKGATASTDLGRVRARVTARARVRARVRLRARVRVVLP